MRHELALFRNRDKISELNSLGPDMPTGYVDESGTPSPASGGQSFTVALLLVQTPRQIETLVRCIRRSLHRRAAISELKAARSHPKVIHRLLNGWAAVECEIYIMAVDKQGIAPQQSEAVYRAAVANVVYRCVERHPQVNLYLDRRYSNRAQQTRLEQTIREAIAKVPMQVVLIEQLDSQAVPGLQAVDSWPGHSSKSTRQATTRRLGSSLAEWSWRKCYREQK